MKQITTAWLCGDDHEPLDDTSLCVLDVAPEKVKTEDGRFEFEGKKYMYYGEKYISKLRDQLLPLMITEYDDMGIWTLGYGINTGDEIEVSEAFAIEYMKIQNALNIKHFT